MQDGIHGRCSAKRSGQNTSSSDATRHGKLVLKYVIESEHARFEDSVYTTLLPLPTLSGAVLSFKAAL